MVIIGSICGDCYVVEDGGWGDDFDVGVFFVEGFYYYGEVVVDVWFEVSRVFGKLIFVIDFNLFDFLRFGVIKFCVDGILFGGFSIVSEEFDFVESLLDDLFYFGFGNEWVIEGKISEDIDNCGYVSKRSYFRKWDYILGFKFMLLVYFMYLIRFKLRVCWYF